MATLQAAAGLALFAVAAWRLRSAYRSRSDAGPSRLWGRLARVAGLRGRRRPPVGDDPVRWKEFHAPESAGPARLVVLVGLGLVAHMTVFDLRFNLAHRLLAWEELFRYGLDPGPWGIHQHARNGMNYVLSEKAATLAGVAMAASAVLAAAGVAGERARGTWDGLLATPIDRASILRAKMLGAAWGVRWPVGLALLIYLLSLASTAMHPVGFVLASTSLATFLWFAVALGAYVSTRSSTASRAIARTVATLLAVELAPVAALAPFVGGYSASLTAAPRLLLELPLSGMRVHVLWKALGAEPVAAAVVGVALAIVAAHGLVAWLLTRAAAWGIGREAG